MNWAPEVFIDGKWSGNALVFATEQEAVQWGKDLLLRWYVPSDSRAVKTDRPVNYMLVDYKLVSVVEAQ